MPGDVPASPPAAPVVEPPAAPSVAPPSASTDEGAGPDMSDRARHAKLHRGTIELTHAQDVYVRSGPGQLVTGTLQRGDRFEVSSFTRDGLWAWGRAGGDAARNGWVFIGSPTKSWWTQVDATPDGGVTAQRNVTPQYEPYVNGADKRAGMTFTRRATVLDPSTAKLYGNYSPDRGPSDELPADFLRSGNVGVRYSPHPDWVIVFRGAARAEGGHVQWGYMRRSDLEIQPDAKYEAWQARRGVTDDEMWGPGPVAGG